LLKEIRIIDGAWNLYIELVGGSIPI